MTSRPTRNAMGLIAGLLLSVLGGVSDDWPMYKHDRNRSGETSESLSFPMQPVWMYKGRTSEVAWNDFLRNPSHTDFAYAEDTIRSVVCDFDWAVQPIVVDGTIYVASSADDTVRALDLIFATEKWRFTADGPAAVYGADAFRRARWTERRGPGV